MNIALTMPGWITLAVLLVVLVFLVRSNRAPDLILWAGLAILMVIPVRKESGWELGVIVPTEALSGLANEGVVTIAAMFAIAAGLKETGALRWLSQKVMGIPGSLSSAQNRIMWPTAVFSAFMNNTPLVAMLLPIVDEWSKQHRLSASKLLMPLSFASILGGACTLIGTSTNLVVNGWIIEELEHPGLGMFEISIIGIPVALMGILYILFAQRWLLKDRKPAISDTDDARQYTVEMMVESGGPLVGKSIQDAGLRGLPGLYLIEIDRAGEILPAVSSNISLLAEDRLIFAGIVESVVDLQKIAGLRVATNQVFKMNEPLSNRILIEAVVSNSCPLIGKSIRDGHFRTIYNAAIIAVARNGERIRKKIGDIVLRPGDTLLLETRQSFAEQQRNNSDFYLVSTVAGSRPLNNRKAGLSLALLVSLILLVTSGVMSMLQAALLISGAMVLSKCCSASVARQSIDMQTLLVIAAAIGLGKAMELSGLALAIGDSLQTVVGMNPDLMLFAILSLTMLLGNLITAKAGAVLMLPIVVAIAGELGVSEMPFIIAVMFASATSLATPISYPTNLMVYGAGGYRFQDYLRLGLPLSVMMIVAGTMIIPKVWVF
ncbi:MAG: TRAP transporter large permease subunit [Gammaproteobacteria bacterium]|nr:TRAP transporter large permease subunit [Gammaproteobacteria bacterium]